MIDYTQHDQYQVMHGVLNERQWRLYVATEAKRRGRGGISQVAREAAVTRKTIHKGLQELEAGELYEPGGRMRRKGGGRKQVTARDETLRADLEELLEPKGEQPRLVRWTTKAMSKLKEALKSQGHTMGENGNPRGRTRPSMCMITAPSPTGKRFPTGFTMWSTTVASSMLVLITRPRSLLWRVSDAGGAALGAACIQPVRNS